MRDAESGGEASGGEASGGEPGPSTETGPSVPGTASRGPLGGPRSMSRRSVLAAGAAAGAAAWATPAILTTARAVAEGTSPVAPPGGSPATGTVACQSGSGSICGVSFFAPGESWYGLCVDAEGRVAPWPFPLPDGCGGWNGGLGLSEGWPSGAESFGGEVHYDPEAGCALRLPPGFLLGNWFAAGPLGSRLGWFPSGWSGANLSFGPPLA